MKAGRSISQIAQEIEQQMATRKDYIAPTGMLSMHASEQGGVRLSGVNGDLAIRPTAHAQIAQDLDIPKAYYDRMLATQPKLLAENANTWLQAKPVKRLVRTLDGGVRGWLTDKFRPLDNMDLMQTVLPIVKARGLTVESAEMTETRLYIKVVDRTLTAPAPHPRRVGDIIAAGAVATNSEIGFSRLSIESLVWQLSCLNGMISGLSLKRMHVGKRHESFDDAVLEVLSTEAKEASDKALWLAFRDTLQGALNPEVFGKLVDKLNAAADRKIIGPVEKVVERVVEVVIGSKSDALKASVLRAMIDGGDLSQYGLQYAITQAAQSDDLNYDEATDLERAGGKVIDLSPSDFKVLAA